MIPFSLEILCPIKMIPIFKYLTITTKILRRLGTKKRMPRLDEDEIINKIDEFVLGSIEMDEIDDFG